MNNTTSTATTPRLVDERIRRAMESPRARIAVIVRGEVAYADERSPELRGKAAHLSPVEFRT